MRNFGLRETIRETEQHWSEFVGFIVLVMVNTAGIVAIAAMIWIGLTVLAWPAQTQKWLPDARLTPGLIDPAATKERICDRGYSTGSVRPSVEYTTALKRQQIAAYGYARRNVKLYEEDHLVPLELGGHPIDPRNLWPEVWIGKCGAHVKDKLENRLHALVCAGKLELGQAQAEIAANWVRAYNVHIGRLVCR